MKSIFQLKSGLVFWATAGLPILIGICAMAMDIALASTTKQAGLPNDLFANAFIGSLLLGFLIYHCWALAAGWQLANRKGVLGLNKWAFYTFGLLSLIVLLLVLLEGVISLSTTTYLYQQDNVRGYSAVRPSINWMFAGLVIAGTWYLPRLLLFGLLAALLCNAEGNRRWASTSLLFIFWPVGVWFLQPRLRRVFFGGGARGVEEHLVG